MDDDVNRIADPVHRSVTEHDVPGTRMGAAKIEPRPQSRSILQRRINIESTAQYVRVVSGVHRLVVGQFLASVAGAPLPTPSLAAP